MVTKTVNGRVHGISFMTHFLSKMGTSADIYYYGRDIESFKALVVDQLKQVVNERNLGMLGVFVHFPENFKASDVCEFLVGQLEFNHGPALNGTTIIISQKLGSGK